MTRAVPERVVRAIAAEPWLMEQAAFDQLCVIAERANAPELASRYSDADTTRELSVRVAAPDGLVGVLNLHGPLFRRANLLTEMSGATSTEMAAAEFARLDADPNIARVVLNIDGPGGQASGTGETAELIASSATPVDAFISGIGASGHYWLAAVCDRVYASPTAFVGSVGAVIAIAADDPDAPKPIYSRYAKDKGGSDTELQYIVDRMEEEFHAGIAEGRGVSVEHVRTRFGNGRLFVGRDAVEPGLVDQITTFDQVLMGTTTEPAARPRRRPPPPPTPKAEDIPMPDPKNPDAGAAAVAGGAPDVAAGVSETEVASRVDTARTEATGAERARVVAILAAGAAKPMASVHKVIELGLSAEDAASMLEAVPDASSDAGLSDRMRGTDPSVSHDRPDPDAKAAEDKAIDDGWAEARAAVYGEDV